MRSNECLLVGTCFSHVTVCCLHTASMLLFTNSRGQSIFLHRQSCMVILLFLFGSFFTLPTKESFVGLLFVITCFSCTYTTPVLNP